MLTQQSNKEVKKETKKKLFVVVRDFNTSFPPMDNGVICTFEKPDVIHSNLLGKYNIRSRETKQLVPIEEISNLTFRNQNDNIDNKKVLTISDFGNFISGIINKKTKLVDGDIVSVYATSSRELTNQLIYCGKDIVFFSLVVFGMTNEDNMSRVTDTISSYCAIINRTFYKEDSSFIFNITGKFDIASFPKMEASVKSIREHYNKFLCKRDDIIKNINFSLDGDSEFCKIKSNITKLSKLIENSNLEVQRLSSIKSYFSSLHKIKEFLKLEEEYSKIELDFSIDESCRNIQFKTPDTYSTSNCKRIRAVSIPTIAELKSAVKETNNKDVLQKFIEYIDKEEDSDYMEEIVERDTRYLSEMSDSRLMDIGSDVLSNRAMDVLFTQFIFPPINSYSNGRTGQRIDAVRAWLVENEGFVDDIDLFERVIDRRHKLEPQNEQISTKGVNLQKVKSRFPLKESTNDVIDELKAKQKSNSIPEPEIGNMPGVHSTTFSVSMDKNYYVSPYTVVSPDGIEIHSTNPSTNIPPATPAEAFNPGKYSWIDHITDKPFEFNIKVNESIKTEKPSKRQETIDRDGDDGIF